MKTPIKRPLAKGKRLPRRQPAPGMMMEYGWFERRIEDEIEQVRRERRISRADAIIIVFNRI